MIKVNEIARLKVTGEDVFVLDIQTHNGAVRAPFTDVTVRRPVMSRDGVKHFVEHFTASELLTVEEFRTKELADRMAMQQQILAAGGTDAPNPLQVV